MLRPLRVLIAEDSPTDAELTVRALRRAGFEPEWQRVDREPDFAAALCPELDVILSDYAMPDFSGLRALEVLKEHGLEIPFIIVSGTIGEDIAVAAIKEGATDYLLKDRLVRLGTAIEHALEQGRLRRDRKQAEDGLKVFRALVDQSSDTFEVIDPATGRFLDVNEKGPAELGCSRAEYLALRVCDIDPSVAEADWPVLVERIRKAGSLRGQGRHRRMDGTEFDIEFSAKWVRLDRDYIVTVVRDITERKQAEQLAADALNFKKTILNASPMGVLTYAEGGQCVSANESAARLVGATVDALMAQNFRELESWKKSGWREAAERALQTGREQEVEARFVTTFGKDVWLAAQFTAFHYQGKPHLLALFADISQRERVQAELRAANERYGKQEEALISLTRTAATEFGDSAKILGQIAKVVAHTLDVGRVSIWRYEREQKDIVCTVLYERLEDRHSTGTILKEEDFPTYFRALAAADVIAAHDAHRDPRTAEFSEAYLTPLGIGAMLDAPIQVAGVVAGVLCCEHFGAARQWGADEQTFAVAVANLVSLQLAQEERKKLEAQFLRAQRMESIGTLASGVAHDLNNILSPVLMSAPLLRRHLSPKDRNDLINTIEMSAERGAQIVKQVLTFGRGLEGEKCPLQVGSLVKELMKIIHQTFPKNIALESALGPDLPLVCGDATQIHQVLLNLCVNARDAMPNGGRLRLGVSHLHIDSSYAAMLPEATPGSYVLLEVSDSGSGISPQIVERIFDPFFTTKGIGKGTGLGLSTVHGIIKSHGGFIKVASELREGTTFHVYLPALPADIAADDATAEADVPEGRGEVVLVVDDEASVRNAARTALSAFGYEVLLADDGPDALGIFAANSARIAVVLTDLMMPHMDGVALIRALRKMQPGVKIIASTGLGEKAKLDELKAMEVATVLHKPYGAETLLRTLHGVLHQNA